MGRIKKLTKDLKHLRANTGIVRNVVFDDLTAGYVDQVSAATGISKSEIVRRLVVSWAAHQPPSRLLPASKFSPQAMHTLNKILGKEQ